MALIVVIVGGAAAIAWTSLGRWESPKIGPRQADYYNLLVSGFRKGSLALDIEVPETLRRLKDPWAPGQRMPDGVPHDVSYYKGHFYLYFGVAPAVVLFWPFRILTGHDLPLVLGSLAFGIGAYFVTAWLWLRMVRDHFRRAGWMTKVAGVAALGLAGGQWVLARRVSIWEPSIEAGHFFLICMVASGYRALTARRPWGWLAASGLALGLATGSRPTLAVAGIGLVWLVAVVGRKDSTGGGRLLGRRIVKAAFAAGFPLGAVAVGLLAYNRARFGNPFEFGLNYQLTISHGASVRHFSASYLPFNFFTYFLASPQWGRYFPFVHPIAWRAQPIGYYGYEYVYGALIVCPVLWWAMWVLPCIRRADPVVRSFAMMLALIALATTSVLLCFETAAARYETDFLPWWVWLGMLGWSLVEDRLGALGRKKTVRASYFAFGACAGFSCLTAFCISSELHGILQFDNPAAYRSLSRLFDGPTALWERLTGYRGGAVTMNLTFAERPLDSVEPLVVTGVEYQKDYVYVYYQTPHVVRFCYAHPGEPVASSADVAVEPGHAYPVRIECGSLYPPEGHPAYDGWGAPEVEALKRWVKIDFDGRTVLTDSRSSNEASPSTLQIGSDKGGAFGRRFAGKITQVRRVGWVRPENDFRPGGDLSLVVALPNIPLPANNQPLLAAGRPDRADMVGLRMRDSDQYGITYESWGSGLWQSKPLRVPSDRMVSFRIRLGPLLGLDDASPLGILARSLVIWEDGAPIWWQRTRYPLDPHPPFYFMSNAIGSSAMAPAFQGRLVSARRMPLAAWHAGPFAALEMELGGRGGGSEPLLATGRSGHSDTLAIDWLADGRVRFLYDHWGHGITASKVFDWPDPGFHWLRLEMPSSACLDASHEASEGAGRLRVCIDRTCVWEAPVSFYAARSETVAVGRNTSGSSIAGPELRCVVMDVRQK